MAISAEGVLLVDTSVAVALTVTHVQATRAPVAGRSRSRCARPLHSKFLGAEASASLLGRLDSIGIAGGSVYDALVGAAAAAHKLPLASRDRRALETYRALGIEVEFLS